MNIFITSTNLLAFKILILFILIKNILTLENGLARTPPMGWMSWTIFYCEINCFKYPTGCINEQLYKDMADKLVEGGYRDAGYVSVHIDDCWEARDRDSNGRLVANQTRFPSGIKSLAEYMHVRGLKFAIYSDIGDKTCAGFPGTMDHLETDAQTFAEWGSDYLKLDACNIEFERMPNEYIKMGSSLLKTNRPIVYSCSWPAYLYENHKALVYPLIGEHCNLWRNYNDIDRSWKSILSIIHYYVKNQEILRSAQRPGAWNDPDMIVAGNPEITPSQAQVQLSVWAIWSAPLIMSNDLRTISNENKKILLNKNVIAVDQDPLGIFGRMVYKEASLYVFVKEMMPAIPKKELYSYAVAVVNYGTKPCKFSKSLFSLGLTYLGGYSVEDLWSEQQLGYMTPNDEYSVMVNHTSVSMIKATLKMDLNDLELDKML
uniref:Alpha-galactosidase n=1 Tax=Meloidogyne incognita TaxID=6306 RepID=A0A914MLR3_MELIC